MITPTRLFLRPLLLAATLLLSACGTRGPLVLPPKPKAPTPPSAATAAPPASPSPSPLEQAIVKPMSLPSAGDISTQGTRPQ